MMRTILASAVIALASSSSAKEWRWFDIWSLETKDGLTTLSTKALDVPDGWKTRYNTDFEFEVSCTWEGPIEIKVVFLNDEFEFDESVIEKGVVGGSTMPITENDHQVWGRDWNQWWGVSESRGRPAIVNLESERLLNLIFNNPLVAFLIVHITVQEFRTPNDHEVQRRLDGSWMTEEYKEQWLKDKDRKRTYYQKFTTAYELYEKELAIAAMWERCRKGEVILD